MKTIFTATLALFLAACAANGSGGSNQFYGEINAGIESSRTKVGN